MNTVPVFAYHSISDEQRDGTLRWSVSPGDFDEQMALLRQRGCTPLTVSRYAEMLSGKAPMPPTPVLITFDDGFADLATMALPVLRRYGMTATAYVITSWLGAPLSGNADPALDWDQLAELHACGIEIGSHSHTHQALDCICPAELHRETVVSKRVLEDGLHQPTNSFAYPYGYHGNSVRRAVRAAGYTSACAVKNALSHAGDDVFAVARVLIERDTGVAGINDLLDGRGRPLAWRGELLRTRGWRAYRRTRHAIGAGRRSAHLPYSGPNT